MKNDLLGLTKKVYVLGNKFVIYKDSVYNG